MCHLRKVLSRSKFMSVEFRTEKKTRGMRVRLREGSQLVDVCIMRCGRDMPLIKSQLGMISNVLEAVPEKPDMVTCGGDGVVVLKTSDRLPSGNVGLQYPFRIHELQVVELLRKPSNSVAGRLDMFAVLKSWLPRIIDCLEFQWMRSTQYLCREC